jgi:periplasmic protein TonB
MKKNPEIRNQTTTHLFMGIIVALGFVFISFEWTTSEIVYETPEPLYSMPYIIVEQVPITREAPKQSIPIPKVRNLDKLVFNEPLDLVIDDNPIPSDEPVSIGEDVPPVDIPLGEEIIDGEMPWVHVEKMPQFPGGQKALLKFLSEKIVYPDFASHIGISGRVIVEFIIERDGSISSVKIAKGVDQLLDAEAIRVINTMPRWIPGVQNGRHVRVKLNLPVNFVLR